jgi:alkanesulfonate monooxygenase SsuD/methylene tetrahydromethanopterin reductase-like flavin-dependent oxidoreductase (luciferase family)
MIGGGGEKKTLRLVARYADACNVFGDPQMLKHKLEILRQHCETEGRNYDDIEKTVYYAVRLGDNGENIQKAIDDLGALAEAGAQAAIGALIDVEKMEPIQIVGDKVIPAIAGL